MGWKGKITEPIVNDTASLCDCRCMLGSVPSVSLLVGVCTLK